MIFKRLSLPQCPDLDDFRPTEATDHALSFMKYDGYNHIFPVTNENLKPYPSLRRRMIYNIQTGTIRVTDTPRQQALCLDNYSGRIENKPVRSCVGRKGQVIMPATRDKMDTLSRLGQGTDCSKTDMLVL